MDESVAPGVHPEPSAEAFDPDDPWAWASVQDEPEIVDISHCRVTAVLVTQNAARWLPETLTALAGLTRRPDRVIAIDNESTDETLELLDDAIQRREIDEVYLGRHGYGYGDAIRSALSQDIAVHPEAAAPPGPDEWLWLLHDDAAPAPEALAQLLGHVVTDPSIDITGPKLLRPRRRHRPYQIAEIGESISTSGRRHLGLDSGEIDQGQRDQPARRLAVSSCAMLVRRSVWDELGGFDPAIPGFRDGLEFGWRAQLAGHKVLTTPAAAVVHRQVGRAGLRPSGFGGTRPEKTDREFGMALIAAHAPAGRGPFVWLRLLLGSLVRAVAFLIGKVPGQSGDELAAAWSFIRHPRRIHRMRTRIRSGRITPRGQSIVARLRPARFSGIRAGIDVITAAIGNRYVEIAGTEPEAASLDELTSDELSSTPDEKKNNPWFSPIMITLVLSVVACLVAARRVIGLGSLAGPQLLPINTDLGRLWHNFLDAVPGSPHTTTAPWTGLIAAAATIFAGQPEWLVTVLLVGTVPLGLLSVYPLLRRTIEDRRIRLWVAISYALLPVLLGGSNQGRLVLTVAAIMLPVLAIAGRALVLRRVGHPEAWRGGWGAGLALTVLGAFAPSLIVVALLLAVIAAFTVARQPRKIGRLAIAVGTPLVILSPWWPTILSSWGRLLTGPDPELEGTAVPGSGLLFLIGRDGGAGLPPLWIGLIVFGSFWAIAVAGLLRGYRRRSVLAGWLVGLVSLAVAVGLSRLLVDVPPAHVETRPYVGIFLLIAFGALVLAGGIGVDGYSQELGGRSFSVVQPLSVLAGVLAALISLMGAGWWLLDGMSGPVHRTQLTAIPPYIVDAQTGPNQVRTLAIDLRGGRAAYSVVAGDQTRLGDPERGYSLGGSVVAREQVSSVVSRLVSGSGDTDLAPDLADLGINYVWVSGADDDARSRITNTPGLSPASGSATGVVWQLTQPTSRVRLVSGQQIVRLADDPDGVRIPASSLQRILRLGVPADPRWRATLDGRPLMPLNDGNWQQSFTVPASGGLLRYHLASPIPWLPIGQGAALLITMVLAAPGVRRPEVRDPVQVARRVATVGPGGGSRIDLGGPITDFTELTTTGGFLTVSDGVTTSTGGSDGEGLLGTTTLDALRSGEQPMEATAIRSRGDR
ncbi:glycosyltransferase [Microlunatus sp. Gsoil 973]|uniref:glycosyltransferase n=1 Tax=Microlunatus sp. Gsoil 973 TaxID=2672569 RepID=UPI0012B4A419|nr:glycosyltransferase [Microlunatus sp. Gsoil 973]QGN31504.1 glycosyltransferase [Microlunatus sp. Gsoil 973]